MQRVTPVKIAALLWTAIAAALVGWVTATGFYGSFPPIHLSASAALWLAAVLCAVGGVVVRRRIEERRIGFDRSQLQPSTVAQLALCGQAVAWMAALIGGLYAGVGVHVLFNAGRLMAAQQDVPGVLAGFAGGIAAAVAGVWLERGCIAPPADSALLDAE
ncbi:hypothetical protein CHEID_01485 [Corynebacterium heidelbergense]|uniref:DUF3180 domain-containing protein n=1 Tax=Corynebacterium heidelbergense TaxID=2055947 RepID=UPI0023587807|nr:DUF3180 domain-containing protein [Corynebacterium heidelbergense]WCZ35875.1 hypothetical protein CHEID_01485 [Corynebacterium heidelbergense]